MSSKWIITIGIFIFLVICLYPETTATPMKDRFNLYKEDALHMKNGNNQELIPEFFDEDKEIKQNFFYRIPMFGMEPDAKLKQHNPGKRMSNHLKNYMIDRPNLEDLNSKVGFGSLYDIYIPSKEIIEQE